MSQKHLSISRIERRLSTGNTELLEFQTGVNLLVGPPNAGKTKWLQTLDFLLGDTGGNPYEADEETDLADKYDAASVYLKIGDEEFVVERRWQEAGARSKVFLDGDGKSGQEFQHWLMGKLNIPILHFPKGNPMSGQTWPELSFRMLLRHIYRQQRFWSDLADKQPEREQHACLLQFLGLAEAIYTEDYGTLIQLRIDLGKLVARKEQYSETLNDVARDILADPGMTVSITSASLVAAHERLSKEIAWLRERRIEMLETSLNSEIAPEFRGHLNKLGERRAALLSGLEESREELKKALQRTEEMKRYQQQLSDELSRIQRAEDAGAVISDIRISHCPACDQTVKSISAESDNCFLCHQDLPSEPVVEGLGKVRLRFERDRLKGELDEVESLVGLLTKDVSRFSAQIFRNEEELRSVERELEPSRHAISAVSQEEISAIDVKLGEAIERERQLGRVGAAVDFGKGLDAKIEALEKKIAPLKKSVDSLSNSLDYDAAADMLENGMNDYLNSLNLYRPGSWRHSGISVDLTKSGFNFKVGRRRWQSALGGTDSLYFLMAYHYGLLSLSNKINCHYPGLSIIDVPGEFSGEAIADKENFIVQPFVELMKQDDFASVQLIMTGAAFENLDGAKFQRMTEIYLF